MLEEIVVIIRILFAATTHIRWALNNQKCYRGQAHRKLIFGVFRAQGTCLVAANVVLPAEVSLQHFLTSFSWSWGATLGWGKERGKGMLHSLFPPPSNASQRSNLRKRTHLLQLPYHTTHLSDKNFITHVLYKNAYYRLYAAVCRYSVICNLLANLLIAQFRRLSMTLCYVMRTFSFTFLLFWRVFCHV